jgi:hypothetical protein
VSENRMMRIFGPEEEEVFAGWKSLHNEVKGKVPVLN